MSDKITFKQLVELIAKQSKQSESSANSFIHELVEIIESGLKDSGSVSISGFGKFELRWMKERAGVNPQTGDEITIPGQNKVVFKPYKALRKNVNEPFSHLEPKILDQDSESDKGTKDDEGGSESTEDPFGLAAIFDSDDPSEVKKDEKESVETPDALDLDSDVEYDPDDPFGFDEKKDTGLSQDYNQYVDDLIYEKENPHFGKSQADKSTEEEQSDDDVLVLEREMEDDEKGNSDQKPKVTPFVPDESKMAQKVQESGSFKWSYAAAVIIVMIALILLFWMMQRSGDSIEQTASNTGSGAAAGTQNQTEQVIEPSTPAGESESTTEETPLSAESEAESAAGGPPSTDGSQTAQSDLNQQSPSSPDQTGTVDELETETFTVESGQSLWDIAENQMGNPYLWPVIYHLNQDLMSNPNELLAQSDLEIPTFSDPDNLSEFEREQVAMGYFSLYQWNREYNPDEAQYFLWAVGVFSQDMLDQPPSEVNPEDLAFARNR